jgi:hypothetical protein
MRILDARQALICESANRHSNGSADREGEYNADAMQCEQRPHIDEAYRYWDEEKRQVSYQYRRPRFEPGCLYDAATQEDKE